MKFEIGDITKLHKALEVPIRTEPQTTYPDEEKKLRQRLIREETNELDAALGEANLVNVADGVIDTMVVVAGTLVQFGLHPKVDEFCRAAGLLTRDLRELMCKAIAADDYVSAIHHAIMLEIIMKGIAGSLNLPYKELWDEVQANNMSKLGPDGKPIKDRGGKFLKPESWKPPRIRQILIKHKLIKPGIEDQTQPLTSEQQEVVKQFQRDVEATMPEPKGLKGD